MSAFFILANMITFCKKYTIFIVGIFVWIFYAFFHVRVLSLGHDSVRFFESIYFGGIQEVSNINWFHPHYAIVKGVYILFLKLFFLLGVDDTVNNALLILSLINITCTSILVSLFYHLIRNVAKETWWISIITTVIFATTFLTWVYLTSLEIYPLSFLMGTIALIQCIDAKKVESNPLKIGVLLFLSSLFHIQNVIIGVIVLIYFLQKSISSKSFVRFFSVSSLLFSISYILIIELNMPDFGYTLNELSDLFETKAGASYSFSVKSIVFVVFSIARTFFGGLFLFSDVLKPTLLELTPLHHLYDEFYLMKNLSSEMFYVLIAITIICSFSLIYLVTKIKFNKLSINLILFLLCNLLIGLYADPLDLDKFIFFPILLLFLIPKLKTHLLIIGSCLLFVNYFGAMQYVKNLDNDFFYSQVKKVEQEYQFDDLIVMDFSYQYETYFNLFSQLENIAYLSDETNLSLFKKFQLAQENKKNIYVHPNVIEPTMHFKLKYKSKEELTNEFQKLIENNNY